MRVSAAPPLAAPVEGSRSRRGQTGQQARQIGPATLHRIHTCLSAALNRAVKARKITFNPALGVDLPVEHRAPVRPWEPEELGRFLDHVQDGRIACCSRSSPPVASKVTRPSGCAGLT